ncbi:MAG: rod shape-determining protein MreC [Candidatus Berkelbacteria bacterium]|nr:rod shape-determining protein MreC [Candidatus Berkelbacteria bacterium]
MVKLLKNRIFLVIVGIIVLFIILNFIIPRKYLLDPTRNFLFRITTPVTKIFYKGGDKTGGFFDKIGEIKRLSDEEAELERKNAGLTLENSKLIEALKENELLRAELGLKQELKDNELVVADIIGRGPTSVSGSFIVNKGKKDGLSEGMPVVSGQMLLGKLTEVDSNFSQVTLIVDPTSVVNVEIQESRAPGIIKGEVGFNVRVDSVPQESPLKVGQRIITSGLGGTMPKGLIVGEIAEITSPESEIFQSARVKPAADFNHLEIVFIISNKK